MATPSFEEVRKAFTAAVLGVLSTIAVAVQSRDWGTVLVTIAGVLVVTAGVYRVRNVRPAPVKKATRKRA